jgi:hypothetical protein
MRLFGIIILALAGFLAWDSNWFHAEKDLSQYPQIRLAYTTCKYERITHYKGSTRKRIVFITENGRYVMEDGVWGRHFIGPTWLPRFQEEGQFAHGCIPDIPTRCGALSAERWTFRPTGGWNTTSATRSSESGWMRC